MIEHRRPRLGAWLAEIDLPRLVLIAAAVDLLLDRILPAAFLRPLPPPLPFLGAWARNFSAILGTAVLGWLTVQTVRNEYNISPPARALMALVGVGLVPLLAWACLTPLPSLIAPYLEACFLFFALACLWSGLRSPAAKRRHKIALLLVTIPVICRGYARSVGAFELVSFGRLDARELAENIGQSMALLAGMCAPLLLPPTGHHPRLLRPKILVVTLLCTVAAGLFFFLRPEASRAAVGALGFRLPDVATDRIFYLAAVAGATWVTLGLWHGNTASRLLVTGLGLVLTAGYALWRTDELAGCALGLLVTLLGGIAYVPSEPLERNVLRHPDILGVKS